MLDPIYPAARPRPFAPPPRTSRERRRPILCAPPWRRSRWRPPSGFQVNCAAAAVRLNARDMRPDGVDQLNGRSEARSLTLVDRRHRLSRARRTVFGAMSGHGVVQERCVQGWSHDHRGSTPYRFSDHDSARLSAVPCASLLSELKLHGANSTTPRGGRGRMARSKYHSTTCTPSTSASSRDAITREAFGDGIARTVVKPSPTSPRSASGQRAAVVVPLSTR